MAQDDKSGAKIKLTPKQLFIERCDRYWRLLALDVPDQLVENEIKLIEQAARKMKGADFAEAMREFPSEVARFRRIEGEVENKPLPRPQG